MKEIIVTNQGELDALPKSFDEYTVIVIKNTDGARISVEARENSSVEARGNSSVVAWGNSSVVAWENSSVVARGNSSVVAWENSSVVAWENSSVEAWGNSSVVAWGNSSVVAWENSSVVAWENSSVEAWGCVSVHLQSDLASVILFMFAVCFVLAKGKVTKKSTAATIVTPEFRTGVDGWLDEQGIDNSESVVLYKKVSADFKTQENTKNETLWAIGSTVVHTKWTPDRAECGAGKFHACSRPYFCDEFRNESRSDKYIAIQVAKADLFAWPNPEYPHKIAFRVGTVLFECNRHGREIKAVQA